MKSALINNLRNAFTNTSNSESTKTDEESIVDVNRVPEPEVVAKNSIRLQLTAKYKFRILEAVDACEVHGDLAKLLRREGLYSTQIKKWRGEKTTGILSGLSPKKRGLKATPVNPLSVRVSTLEKERNILAARLKRAEAVIEIQKKVSEILGAVNLAINSELSSCK